MFIKKYKVTLELILMLLSRGEDLLLRLVGMVFLIIIGFLAPLSVFSVRSSVLKVRYNVYLSLKVIES